jgi:hypothetical protein
MRGGGYAKVRRTDGILTSACHRKTDGLERADLWQRRSCVPDRQSSRRAGRATGRDEDGRLAVRIREMRGDDSAALGVRPVGPVAERRVHRTVERIRLLVPYLSADMAHEVTTTTTTSTTVDDDEKRPVQGRTEQMLLEVGRFEWPA